MTELGGTGHAGLSSALLRGAESERLFNQATNGFGARNTGLRSPFLDVSDHSLG